MTMYSNTLNECSVDKDNMKPEAATYGTAGPPADMFDQFDSKFSVILAQQEDKFTRGI